MVRAASSCGGEDSAQGDGVFVRLGGTMQGPMTLAQASERLAAGVYSRYHEACVDREHWRPLADAVSGMAVASPTIEIDPTEDAEEDEGRRIDFGVLEQEFAEEVPAVSGLVSAEARDFSGALGLLRRWSLRSWGGLLLTLSVLPVAAFEGQTRHWWSWPAGERGVAFAWTVGLWSLLGTAGVGLSFASNMTPRVWRKAVGGLLLAGWCAGWPALFSGMASGATAGCWLVAWPVAGLLGAVLGGLVLPVPRALKTFFSSRRACLFFGLLVLAVAWGVSIACVVLAWSMEAAGGPHGEYLVRACMIAAIGTASAGLMAVAFSTSADFGTAEPAQPQPDTEDLI